MIPYQLIKLSNFLLFIALTQRNNTLLHTATVILSDSVSKQQVLESRYLPEVYTSFLEYLVLFSKDLHSAYL